mgnify:CR=1 FL=1|tara:strand:- start:2914 stop:4011 length:1098 start_codon:yes stop_codon:yes gene_type:complete
MPIHEVKTTIIRLLCAIGILIFTIETNALSVDNESQHAVSITSESTALLNRIQSEINAENQYSAIRMTLKLDHYWTQPEFDQSYGNYVKNYSSGLLIPNALELNTDNRQNLLLILHRFSATLKSENVDFKFGLQRFPLGVGRIWRPTDVINSFNPVDIMNMNNAGQWGGGLTYSLAELSQIHLFTVLNATTHINGARMQFNVAQSDVGISVIEHPSGSVIGVDAVGEWVGYGIGTYSEWSWRDNMSQYVIGFDTILSDQISLFTEYYVNGWGQDLSNYTGDVSAFKTSSNYIGSQIGYQFTPLLVGQLKTIIDINRSSFLLLPQMGYSLQEHIDIGAGILLPFDQGGASFTGITTTAYFWLNSYF